MFASVMTRPSWAPRDGAAGHFLEIMVASFLENSQIGRFLYLNLSKVS
eukprot:14670.XXX_262180_262320_1 [CDS] Oithona nana genome sequencing.